MTNLEDDLLRIELGESWFALPAAREEFEASTGALLDGFAPIDAEARRQLLGGLDAVFRLTESLAPGTRTSHVLITNPASGRVQALLSIRLSRVTPEAYDNYLDAARGYAGDAGVEVVNRVVEPVRLPTGRGILSRDFTLPVQREGVADPVLERCFLALFPEGYETAVEFTLLTQNLALFDDAGSYLLALASGERPTVTEERS
ncbi:MAG: hypothetical protein DI534_06415 [Leifsonia xyli]|nr:MAG: hypothetical protein DI534_06415 [Leifsonia xyli]